jgi:hypothetical protein
MHVAEQILTQAKFDERDSTNSHLFPPRNSLSRYSFLELIVRLSKYLYIGETILRKNLTEEE